MLRLILFSLLLCTSLLGAEAKIDGPSTVRPGQFTVLDTNNSVIGEEGQGFWIFDPSLPEDWQSSQCGGVLNTAFELPVGVTEVTYHFHYVAYDSDGHSFATHEVLVRRPGASDPVPAPEPDPLPTLPSPDFGNLTSFTKNLVTRVNDPVTQKALYDNLNVSLTGTVAQMSAKVTNIIENTLLLRTGTSRSKDWLNGWRIPLNTKISELNIETTDDYIKAIKAIRNGLSSNSATNSQSEKPLLVIYTIDKCPSCKLWKSREKPLLKGWEIIELSDVKDVPLYPYFELIFNGDVKYFKGYQKSSTLITATKGF